VQYAVVRQECRTAGGNSPPRPAVPVCADCQTAEGRRQSAEARCAGAVRRRRYDARSRGIEGTCVQRPGGRRPYLGLSIGIRFGLSIS
jgi:hypothetical protein